MIFLGNIYVNIIALQFTILFKTKILDDHISISLNLLNN